MTNLQDKLQQYAQLLVNVGMNIQKGNRYLFVQV